MKKAIKSTTLADRLLFLFLMIASLAGMSYARDVITRGPDIVIEVAGRPAYTVPLDTDREIPIDGREGHAVIEIKNGLVRMKEADCDNRTCIKQGWISQGAIVCMPNGIVVIVGTGSKKGMDAITG